MAFSRNAMPASAPSPKALTAAMAGIGMGFAAKPDRNANIEDTLLFASVEAMDRDDLRVLAVLVTWFGVHHDRVNADRLFALVAPQSERVRALWSALATWQAKDRRFARLRRHHQGNRLDLLQTGTDFHIRRRGEDPRFENGSLRVPAGVLRDRPDDVVAPAMLARRHGAYRYRVQMGAGFRADCWAALEHDGAISAAELARRSYASFATAWQARRDFGVLHANSS
jgi:hypothetical protein